MCRAANCATRGRAPPHASSRLRSRHSSFATPIPGATVVPVKRCPPEVVHVGEVDALPDPAITFVSARLAGKHGERGEHGGLVGVGAP